MCGICGMFDLKNERRVEQAVIGKMTGKLLHRGPDAVGHYIKDNLALGFTRLSIIDLEGGMQPLWNEDHTLVMLCNGEIFNYLDLRKNLVAKGHQFKTNCDVEVLVHLYEESGPEFIKDLNGQFAFVIFDSRKNLLLCARDQVGIAPFFYTIVDQMFIFASEMKAILEHPLVKREIDIIGMDQILTFPGMISPRTLIKDIHSLESGHYLILMDSTLKNIEYWDLIYPKTAEIEYRDDEEYYIETLDELLTRAVKLRLQADVPVGFYISGGLDSALVAAKIFQIDGSDRRHSFSIDFPEKNLSESKYQRIMARVVNSNHHEKLFHFSDISARLPQAVYHSEAALKETYNTASLALSESVKAANIKVTLTGEGADELFGGYVGYKFDKFRQQQPAKTGQNDLLEREIRRKIWGDPDFIYEKDCYPNRVTKQELYAEPLHGIFTEIDAWNHPVVNQNRIQGIDLLHQRSYIDFKLRLSDHLLSDHGDRMAYANSVEARYPFLDKDLIEFVRLIPPGLKLKQFTEKYILKKIAATIVPREIIDRPKFAFVAPGSPELLQEGSAYIQELLSDANIRRQGIFNPNTVEKLKNQYQQPGFKLNLPYDSDLLIMVISCGMFMDSFKISGLN
ncbi:MAG TPA: asparagine synthase (glutamine-hydrolyzing) [Bacillota bacterium]|nr:asparagine synthase (glutamine-hydrolyzing) [Bacillota bacterium]